MNNSFKKIILFPMNLLYKIAPVLEIKIMFLLKNGYRLNLTTPVTFNEKLQWIKFFDKNPKLAPCSDKYAVRDYVKECGCEEILNHLIWEGYKAEEIPFASLPDKFVIKVTHGSGFNIICKDKSKLQIKKVIKQLNHWLEEKYIRCYGEWFYGVVKPRIIIEDYLGDESGNSPIDYKLLCFHGEPKLIQVHTGRFAEHKMKLYDMEWNEKDNCRMKYINDRNLVIDKPQQLQRLIEYAKILSNPFYFARVDFYIVKGNIYFGEITFTDGAGFDKIYPYTFDVELGSYIKLP